MAVDTLDTSVSVTDDVVDVPGTDGAEAPPAASLTLFSPLNRTLTGWEVLFFSFVVLLGTALLVDLWFLLHPGP